MTTIDHSPVRSSQELVREIHELCGQDALKCYQCGRCTAGCPVVDEMDLMPNQISRFIQLGLEQEVLGCKSIWVCVSCFMCESRCPKGVDLATLMEALRFLAVKRGYDHFGPNQADVETLKRAPQQAFVSAYRKQSS